MTDNLENKKILEGIEELKNSIEELKVMIQQQQTTKSNSNKEPTTTRSKTKTPTVAINNKLRRIITTNDGMTLFEHMTRGPSQEWYEKKEEGKEVSYKDYIAVITNRGSKSSKKIKIKIKRGSSSSIKIPKELIDKEIEVIPDEIKVLSLWNHDKLGTDFEKFIQPGQAGKKTLAEIRNCEQLTEEKIVTISNHIWRHLKNKDKIMSNALRIKIEEIYEKHEVKEDKAEEVVKSENDEQPPAKCVKKSKNKKSIDSNSDVDSSSKED